MGVLCFFVFVLGFARISYLDAATLDSSIQNTIEARVIVDKWAISSWKSKLGVTTDAAATAALTNYINSAFGDLNSIFGGLLSSGINLDARIVNIEYITDEDVTPEYPVGSGQSDGDAILADFKQWLASKNYASSDHTMLLTGLDIASSGDTKTAGKAYLGRMCNDDYAISVSEIASSAQVVSTIAHELGHNLNCSHDGDGNACIDGYIMQEKSSGNKTETAFQFSSCSINYIKTFLENLIDSGSCLSASETTLPAHSAIPLGELYDPDQTCRLNYGSDSYFCRTLYGYNGGKDYTSVCHTIYCKSTDGDCWTVSGADGFVCGNGKKCSLGQCVDDTSAPTDNTDTCPLGDINYPMNTAGQTCGEAISQLAGYCYDDFYRRGCCALCEAAETTVAGCEYGDRSTGCAPLTFPYDCNAGNNGDTCCGSCIPHETGVAGCEYGDKSTFCSTVSWPPKACYYGNNASCCATCPGLETGIAGCEYGDSESWCADYIAANIDNCAANSGPCCYSCKDYVANTDTDTGGGDSSCTDIYSNCASAVAANPGICYDYEAECCASCTAAVTGTGTCKYGDKSTDCAGLNYPSTCYSNEDVCCASCAQYDSGNPDCKYGDRYGSCVPGHCTNYSHLCCETCSA